LQKSSDIGTDVPQFGQGHVCSSTVGTASWTTGSPTAAAGSATPGEVGCAVGVNGPATSGAGGCVAADGSKTAIGGGGGGGFRSTT
jgi:hypothetical protein